MTTNRTDSGVLAMGGTRGCNGGLQGNTGREPSIRRSRFDSHRPTTRQGVTNRAKRGYDDELVDPVPVHDVLAVSNQLK